MAQILGAPSRTGALRKNIGSYSTWVRVASVEYLEPDYSTFRDRAGVYFPEPRLWTVSAQVR
jgi:hypothetical protein